MITSDNRVKKEYGLVDSVSLPRVITHTRSLSPSSGLETCGNSHYTTPAGVSSRRGHYAFVQRRIQGHAGDLGWGLEGIDGVCDVCVAHLVPKVRTNGF